MSPFAIASLRTSVVLGVATYAADPAATLRVLRSTPSDPAAPTAEISVTFDRPVAGGLDRSVDPARVLRIEPAVDGVVEWRDPVTLRLRPRSLLHPNTTYRVTVPAGLKSMDGAELAEPHRFTFRVRGAKPLAGIPAGPSHSQRFVAPDAKFAVVFDVPADEALLARLAHVQLPASCTTGGTVRVRVAGQRRIGETDPWELRDAGGWDRNRSLDSLRRIVDLVPDRPLPTDCAGAALVVPSSLDERGRLDLQRWGFSTYGRFVMHKAECGWGGPYCPSGGVLVRFSTPVRGGDILRHLTLRPAVTFTVSDTTDARDVWMLETELRPRTAYAVVVAPALKDVFGQTLGGNPVATVVTTGHAPAVNYGFGRAVIERKGLGTFPVTYVNVDTIEVVSAPIPDSLEARFMGRSEWSWGELWPTVSRQATRRKYAVRSERDRAAIFGVKLDPPDARRRGTPTLYAVQVTSPRLDSTVRAERPIVVAQVTDLGVHARIGATEGIVWVTGASDGRPRAGARVTVHDANGAAVATAVADSLGIARFSDLRIPGRPAEDADESWGDPTRFDGYVAAELGADRAIVGINEYDPDLSPWRFNVRAAWGSDRLPAAVALFAERGIYRPGEPIFAKAIVRSGALGRLVPPKGGDSLRLIFDDRADDSGERAALSDTVVALSRFGTASRRFTIPPAAKLGEYWIRAQLRHRGRWMDVARASYRVAEYRPPEFLVDVLADSAGRVPGDTVSATVEARYLFGAPMGRAAVRWTQRVRTADPWEVPIPGTDGWHVGESGWWYEEWNPSSAVRVTASGTDTLDPSGRLTLPVAVGETERGRPARTTIEAVVTDVNRQTVAASAGFVVHPAAFYIAAKPLAATYFWTAGAPVSVAVAAVRPTGERVAGVRVDGVVIRREWHQTRRERSGYAELVGEWVSDTVARCAVTTAADSVPCRFTPPSGGSYTVTFRATDAAGRLASTSFYRWAIGKGYVPWNDESQFKMDVIPDRARYAVGDTATILFAAPFTDAEAWITIEREGLLEQRRMRITSGTTTLRLPVTEALAPNAFVSILVARGRSAKPGPLDDPGRPTIRVGYAEIRVTPEKKRLAVTVRPARAEYRPGDTASIELGVRDADGTGRMAEVTLWAVDEGVLALTGYRTPDPLDLLYQPRGLGLRLASNLTTVAPQVPEGQKGGRSPGGGGGDGNADVLRSRFQTTAFFLGSVVTGADGRGVAKAKLPDNLTTFRVMAVAVTQGDRYGSAAAPLLVTRPLVARPALPRFLRPGDRFAAGVVVNHRMGGTPKVRVDAATRGAKVSGSTRRDAVLEPGRGREIRFDFESEPSDSASFEFRAASGAESDAVRLAVPLRPLAHPRAFTAAGVLRDSATVELMLPAELDPARSTLALSVGSSPLAFIRGAGERLRIYPYWCTEQVASAAQPLIALFRARRELDDTTGTGRLRREIERAVAMIAARQRADGGIGLWSAGSWTTPWLSAYAGAVLLDARAAGVPVNDSLLARLGRYVSSSVEVRGLASPVSAWYDTSHVYLADRVAAVDFLSRIGLRDRAAENELLRLAPQVAWEDRVRLAAVLARGGDAAASRRLLDPTWAEVKVEGRRAVLPAGSRRGFYFESRVRPIAYLLAATLAVDPAHPLVGPLVETLIGGGDDRDRAWLWNTQDYGTAVAALAEFHRRQQVAARRGVEVRAGGRTILRADAAVRDSSIALSGLVGPARGETRRLTVSLATGSGEVPVFYYLTVTGSPVGAAVRPRDAGVQVERWYEDFESGKPVTTVREGQLVRVRLRVTAPAERQMVVLEDPLPAGLEPIDLSLRTAGELPGPGAADSSGAEAPADDGTEPYRWAYGSWDSGWWSPFDHKELRDDKVVYFATRLWRGSYTATYLARATTPGVFAKPPAHAEEMYNPAVYGESDGGTFTVTAR